MWTQGGKSLDNYGSELESEKKYHRAKFINGSNMKLKYYLPRHHISKTLPLKIPRPEKDPHALLPQYIPDTNEKHALELVFARESWEDPR